MPFTAEEVGNIANALIDYHMDRGKVFYQDIQNKPLLKYMRANQKSFPGGKENITVRVKGTHSVTGMGFTGDDQVTYGNPANIKEATYSWKEYHNGIKVTLTELKKDGISVVDSANSKNTVEHTEREKVVLAGLLDDKIEELGEGVDRDLNLIYWRDGTADPLLPAGVRSFLLDSPTSATVVGGIDQSANSWWRNRVSLALSVTTPSDMTIIKKMKSEDRLLRKFAMGGVKHIRLCGSAFMDALEAELYAKGQFTQTGWTGKGSLDIGQADAALSGKVFEYDPTLDDEGLSKYCYVIDTKRIFPKVMDGEDMKKHAPARPEDRYVMYRAVTWTGGVVCTQRNTSGVYSIV